MCLYIVHGCFTLQWQSGEVGTETLSFTKTKIFAKELCLIFIRILSNLEVSLPTPTLNDRLEQEVNHGSCAGGQGRAGLITLYCGAAWPPARRASLQNAG